MKTTILSLIFIPFIAFSQTKDLSKKEAYTAFKNSTLRIQNNWKLSNFKSIYISAKCYSKENKKALSEMIIFNTKASNEELENYSNFAQSKNPYAIFSDKHDNYPSRKKYNCSNYTLN